jgi:hypothetical protein
MFTPTLAFVPWSATDLVVLCLGMIGLYGLLVLGIVLASARGPELPQRDGAAGPLARPRKIPRPMAAGTYPATKTAKLSPF